MSLLALATIAARHLDFPSSSQKNDLSPVETAERDLEALARRIGAQWRGELSTRAGDQQSYLPITWKITSAFPRRSAAISVNEPPLVDHFNLSKLQAFAKSRPPSERYWNSQNQPASFLESKTTGLDDELAGTFLANIQAGRLLILGDSGTGKTVLLQKLTLDLITARLDSSAPVPVLLMASSWDPGKQDFWDWVESRIIEDHPFLKQKIDFAGERVSRVRLLRQKSLILPIIDGLDELSITGLVLALRKIETSVNSSEAVVASCLRDTYKKSLEHPQFHTLTGATVVELMELPINVVRTFMDLRAPESLKPQWNELLGEATHKTPLGRAFTNVLLVWLAHQIYNELPSMVNESERTRGDRPTDTGPLELRKHSGSEDEIRLFLLGAFVPLAIRSYAPLIERHGRWARRVTRQSNGGLSPAERWLATLARFGYSAAPGRKAFAWWELADEAPAWVPGMIVGSFAALPMAIVSALTQQSGVGLGLGLVTALSMGSFLRYVTARQFPTHPALYESATVGLGVGIVAGLAGGMIGASYRSEGIFGGVSGGIGIGLGAGALCGPLPGLLGAFAGSFLGEVTAGQGRGLPSGLATFAGVGLSLGLIVTRVGRRTPSPGMGLLHWRPNLGIAVGVFTSAAIGIGGGRAFGLPIGILGGVLSFVLISLMVGMSSSMLYDENTITGDRLFSSDRNSFALFAAVGAGGGALSIFLGVSLQTALCGALAGGLELAFLQATWGRYVIASTYFMVKGDLPFNLFTFLNRIQASGVLRRVGNRYDFRHAEVRLNLLNSTSVKSHPPDPGASMTSP